MSKKYPQRYLPKIQYWQYKVNRYINEGDIGQAEYAVKRLSHFIARQYVVENEVELTPEEATRLERGYRRRWR